TTSSNPQLYTREGLHGRFESEYVKAQIKPEDFAGLVKTATKLQHPFADIMKYLFQTFDRVPDLYAMDKVTRWDANNRNADSKKFVNERLAVLSQMLAHLWSTACLGSASNNPDVR